MTYLSTQSRKPHSCGADARWKTATPATHWSLGGWKLQPLQHFGNLPSREAKYFEICGNQIFCFFENQKSKIFCPAEPRKSKIFCLRGKKESKIFCFFGGQKNAETGNSKYFAFLKPKKQNILPPERQYFARADQKSKKGKIFCLIFMFFLPAGAKKQNILLPEKQKKPNKQKNKIFCPRQNP